MLVPKGLGNPDDPQAARGFASGARRVPGVA